MGGGGVQDIGAVAAVAWIEIRRDMSLALGACFLLGTDVDIVLNRVAFPISWHLCSSNLHSRCNN